MVLNLQLHNAGGKMDVWLKFDLSSGVRQTQGGK